MSEAGYVCERTKGQETCPFHPGHKITTLCKTCGVLICFECVIATEHKGHTFKKISECLREPTNNIARYIDTIDRQLLVAIDKELSAIKTEKKESIQKQTIIVQNLKEQGTKLKKDIENGVSSMAARLDKHLHDILDVLDKHIHVLESHRKCLTEERKEYTNVLQDGSEILKYDVGNEVLDKDDVQASFPEHPNIPNLQYIECDHYDALIQKALGTLQEFNRPAASPLPSSTKDHLTRNVLQRNDSNIPLLTTTEHKTTNRYSSFNTTSTVSNEHHRYRQLTPVNNETAWAISGSYESNQLHLLTRTGKSLRVIQTDTNVTSLSVHPVTGQLYGGFRADNTIKCIDTDSGMTTINVKCEIRPNRIKLTRDNRVLVGTNKDKYMYPVCMYKLTGELVRKSHEKYQVCDIDQCTRTKRVAVSCGYDGVVILDRNLNKIHTFTGLTRHVLFTATFDDHGNLIVGDWFSQEVYIVDGDQFNLIQKIHVDDKPYPSQIKLHQHILWIECKRPRKILCIEIS